MYRHIYVPVDNSEHSNAAIDVAVARGKAFGADLVGSHVYAAKMHDYRFRQMEYTLPPEYQDEQEMEKQRRIHDSLITMGLQLISDSYLEVMAQKAGTAGLTCRKVMIDGKNYAELARDIQTPQARGSPTRWPFSSRPEYRRAPSVPTCSWGTPPIPSTSCAGPQAAGWGRRTPAALVQSPS